MIVNYEFSYLPYAYINSPKRELNLLCKSLSIRILIKMFTTIFIYCFITVTSGCESKRIHIPLHETVTFKVLSKLLQNFAEFDIIFHANATTMHFANDLLKTLSLSKRFNTYNVYKDDLTVAEQFKRKKSWNILNIVLTQDATTWGRFNDSNKLNHRDVVLFVFTSDNFFTKLLQDGVTILKISGNTLALQIINKVAMVYRICYYCGKDSLKPILIYSSNTTQNYTDSNLKELLLPNDFKDLNGHVLHFIYVQYFPFAYCKTPVKEIFIKNRRIVNCVTSAGIESNLVRIMSQKLNFSYLVHTLDPNGSFFDMIMYVNKNLADIAFGGISITEERTPLIQFSDQFNSEDYVFLYRLQPNFRQVFSKFVEPFHDYIVWLLFYISYLICCCMLHIYSWINKKIKVYGILYIFWVSIFFIHRYITTRISN